MTAVLAGWANAALAYESYHDPAQDDTGYCADCHPGFTSGFSDVTHALHTGGDDPVTTNCNLCHDGIGRNNPLTMWSVGDADDGLGCAGCHGRDYGETIGADHRGLPIAGLPKSSGFGLRKHHLNSGINVCLGCHADVLQADIEPEDVGPLYYARADVSLGGSPVDSCTNEDSANTEPLGNDSVGLDNDGDHLYDATDPDCAGNVPPVADPNGPYTGSEGAPVTFDGSGSFDPDGTIVAYDWDFGDGNTGTGVSPTHTYAADGLYTVALTVTDDGGATNTAMTTATISSAPNQPPVADPNGPYTGSEGAPVTFDGSGSFDIDGTIVSYMWDFGDGNTGTGEGPTHTYAAPGTYTVSLTVTDDDGATDTATTTATISSVANQPPVADPNGPYTGSDGAPVSFDGSGSSDVDGTIVRYMWDFGDGNTGTGVTPTHTYAAPATYTVSLTVTDDDGATDTATTTATISGSTPIDLDIAQFQATKKVRLARAKPVEIKLTVKNNGAFNSQSRPATVVGMQNGGQVYNETLLVHDDVGNGRSAFTFPSYTPTAIGDIQWTVTIADDDPDVDVATAVTVVN
jgi:PKD repeat protein